MGVKVEKKSSNLCVENPAHQLFAKKSGEAQVFPKKKIKRKSPIVVPEEKKNRVEKWQDF